MNTNTDKAYRAACSYLDGVPRFTKKNELQHTRYLLQLLGNPERSFRVIHVAGTNGKGSVCAFLESILRRAGYRTGLFTSPHLVQLTERFQIDRQEVTKEQFADAFARVMEAVEQMQKSGLPHPAWFELIFAAGMLLFARGKVEVLVCETGLGGRLDATNIIENKELCVITSIGLDHMQYLGNTIQEIAFEKAGILRPGIPVVYDASCAQAAQAIRECAAALGAPTIAVQPEQMQVIGYTKQHITCQLQEKDGSALTLRIPFMADYQVLNCALAVTAARQFDSDGRVTDALIRQAVEATRWSGRMELASSGVVLDGAHNADGIVQFLKTVRRIAKERAVSLLFAASAGKDYEQMVRALCQEELFAFVVVTQLQDARRVEACELAGLFRAHTAAPVYVEENSERAYERALSLRGDSLLFCAGSLYLIGEIEEIIEGRQAC